MNEKTQMKLFRFMISVIIAIICYIKFNLWLLAILYLWGWLLNIDNDIKRMTSTLDRFDKERMGDKP